MSANEVRELIAVNSSPESARTAAIIGAGPNGLAAAITLAQRNFHVNVFEAQPQPGGAARTLDLTLPGFLHDFGSAVHPLAAGSPFFSSLPLQKYGLQWIHSPAPLAHPFDDGTAVTLERDLRHAESVLGPDGKRWCRLMQPFAEHWPIDRKSTRLNSSHDQISYAVFCLKKKKKKKTSKKIKKKKKKNNITNKHRIKN